MKYSWMLLVAGAFCMCPAVQAQKAGHPFVATTFQKNKVIVVSADGKVEWEYEAPACLDVWQLPSGNFLIASRAKGILEVTRDKKVVWQFKPDGETYTCQRLANGLTVVGDNRHGRVVEVDAAGKIVSELKIETAAKEHGMIRTVRKLANDRYLVCQREDNVVREYDSAGKVVWQFKTGGPMSALRLADGNTLISNAAGDALEVDAAGKVVWQFGKKDLPAKAGGVAYGLQRLPNGNTVVGYPGLIVEVARDKSIVWSCQDSFLQGLMCFQLLDVSGDATKGEVVR